MNKTMHCYWLPGYIKSLIVGQKTARTLCHKTVSMEQIKVDGPEGAVDCQACKLELARQAAIIQLMMNQHPDVVSIAQRLHLESMRSLIGRESAGQLIFRAGQQITARLPG